MNKMFNTRDDNKCSRNYTFPTTKLRNVFCTYCKHQFFLREFVPLRGLVPLLLDCGHVICDRCAKLSIPKPCPLCNVISQSEDNKKISLPLNMYALGLMVISHNRPVDTDDSEISFSKSIPSKLKEQSEKGLCHECGLQAVLKCPQCIALYCYICYGKIHGKALQSHSKIMLSEGIHDSSFTVENTCSNQCTEPLGYYCENCEIAGCSHCMLHLHKKHNYKTLLAKNEEFLPEYYSVVKRVTENLQRIHQSQKVCRLLSVQRIIWKILALT
ncbi:protein meiotic P26-like isoform X4 [Megachile rotundata]|uniref:protein meiotic P26-like isoform X4 n=1 Tax=Megachile rotundata TaxID=143995 RepID=UPI003FD36AED